MSRKIYSGFIFLCCALFVYGCHESDRALLALEGWLFSSGDTVPGIVVRQGLGSRAEVQSEARYLTQGFATGATIPGYILRTPSGSRADVTCKGVYQSGRWVVEFSRDLNTGNADDLVFSTATDLLLSLAVTDNSGGTHNGAPKVAIEMTGDTNIGAVTNANMVIAGYTIVTADTYAGIPTPLVLDGDPTDWSTYNNDTWIPLAPVSGSNGITQAYMQVVVDTTAAKIYIKLEWADPTKNVDKNQWTFGGTSWSQSGNEDRCYLMFTTQVIGASLKQSDLTAGTEPYYDSATPANSLGCLAACHPATTPASTTYTADSVMRFGSDTVGVPFADVWHWKAARSNPVGFVDDKRFVSAASGVDGRKSDAGTSTYSDNKAGSGPAKMAAGDPGVNATSLYDGDPLLGGTKAFDATATYSNRDLIPGYTHRMPLGSRADVITKGYYDCDAKEWTVELQRALNTGNGPGSGDEDFVFAPGGADADFFFSLAVTDNSGGTHTGNSLLYCDLNGDNTSNTGGETPLVGTYLPAAFTVVTAYNLATLPVSAPSIDGLVCDTAWRYATAATVALWDNNGDVSAVGAATTSNATVQCAYDGTNIYWRVTWKDSTYNIDKNAWAFDGTAWSQSGNEDRVFFMFPDDTTPASNAPTPASTAPQSDTFVYFQDYTGGGGSTGQGCAVACHADGVMRLGGNTVPPGPGKRYTDVWHWKAQRTDPVRRADDKNFVFKGSGLDGRSSDSGRSAYSNNIDTTVTPNTPAFQGNHDPGQSLGMLLQSWGDDIHAAVPFPTIKGNANTNRWQVIFKRPLTTANAGTQDVDLSAAVLTGAGAQFGVGTWDNASDDNKTMYDGPYRLIDAATATPTVWDLPAVDLRASGGVSLRAPDRPECFTGAALTLTSGTEDLIL